MERVELLAGERQKSESKKQSRLAEAIHTAKATLPLENQVKLLHTGLYIMNFIEKDINRVSGKWTQTPLI